MTRMTTLAADDTGLPGAIERMLTGGPPVAPLPADAASTLAMLRPDEPVVEDDAGLIVGTSGSTGTPKGVVLSRRAVVAGAEATHARLGGPGHWTLAVPAHYVAGIMVIARAVVAGTRLLRAAPDLSDLPRVRGRNYLSLVPTQLVRGLDDPQVTERLAAYDAILLGGAAADAGVLERAAEAGLNVITTYGMSETSGGCVYDGLPLNGVSVDLDPDGRVTITGPVVFSGYRLRPDLTAEVLITTAEDTMAEEPAQHPLTTMAEEPAQRASRSLATPPMAEEPAQRASRSLLTNDRATWSNGRLHILGRLDDVVISGGVNVDLAEVEKALKQIDPHAAAVGVPDPEWGTLVVAAMTDGTTLDALRTRLTTLEPAARPRGLLRHSHLPHTTSGKIDRQTLKAWWDEGPAEKEQM